MTWWAFLEQNGELVESDATIRLDPDSFAPTPTHQAEITINYNYSELLREAYEATLGKQLDDGHTLEQILDDEPAVRTLVPLMVMAAYLQGCATILGPQEGDDDYSQPTYRNVLRTLRTLGTWATNHPDAVWRVE